MNRSKLGVLAAALTSASLTGALAAVLLLCGAVILQATGPFGFDADLPCGTMSCELLANAKGFFGALALGSLFAGLPVAAMLFSVAFLWRPPTSQKRARAVRGAIAGGLWGLGGFLWIGATWLGLPQGRAWFLVSVMTGWGPAIWHWSWGLAFTLAGALSGYVAGLAYCKAAGVFDNRPSELPEVADPDLQL